MGAQVRVCEHQAGLHGQACSALGLAGRKVEKDELCPGMLATVCHCGKVAQLDVIDNP